MTAELMIAIALWCGSPDYLRPGVMEKVLACRERTLACATKKRGWPSTCIGEEKLK